MTRHIGLFALTLLIVAEWTEYCFAQTRTRRSAEDDDIVQSRAQPEGRSPKDRPNHGRLMPMTDLVGATIRLRDDEAFGTVDDLLMDDTGRLVLVVTEFDG